MLLIKNNNNNNNNFNAESIFYIIAFNFDDDLIFVYEVLLYFLINIMMVT